MIKFNVPKNLGTTVVNTLRQFILSETEVVRVVGFSLGEQELLKSGDIDLVNISCVLANLDLDYDDLESYPTIKNVKFNDVLTIGDLRGAGIKILNFDDDTIILNGFKPGTISLILNKCKHYMTASNNKSMLESSQMFNVSGFNIIPSRGSNVDVSFKITTGLDSDLVEFNVKSDDDKRIIKESLKSISSVLEGINSKIS